MNLTMTKPSIWHMCSATTLIRHLPSLVSHHCTHWISKDLSFPMTTAKTVQTRPRGYILGGILQIIPFQPMKIAFIFAKSMNPDEMLHYVVSHLGLHTLSSGNRWLSGRVLDSRPRGSQLELHQHHCLVSLSKTH